MSDRTWTCRVIVNTLMKEEMTEPYEEQWKDIAEDFRNIWNFPNCIGAVDGKHINIEAPANSSSVYFSYKKTFSVILLALVDANYNFIMIDVGSFGRSRDCGIFSHSALGKRTENGSLNIPPDICLPGINIEALFVIVGNEAFPLKTYLMRPYPGRQSSGNDFMTYINNRLARARRVSENAFGILAQKFRFFLRLLSHLLKKLTTLIRQRVYCTISQVNEMINLQTKQIQLPMGLRVQHRL